jgi:hypothetical protein
VREAGYPDYEQRDCVEHSYLRVLAMQRVAFLANFSHRLPHLAAAIKQFRLVRGMPIKFEALS